MPNITKELRQWAKDQFFRKYAPAKSVSYLHAINDFADHIDAELAEHYIALPLDADGIPIHMGDELVDINNTSHRGKACSIELRQDGNWTVFVGSLGRWSDTYRHVKTDSWESIIYDAMQAGRTEETIDVTPLIDRCKALVDIKVKALEDKISELSFHEDMGR